MLLAPGNENEIQWKVKYRNPFSAWWVALYILHTKFPKKFSIKFVNKKKVLHHEVSFFRSSFLRTERTKDLVVFVSCF